MKKAVLCGVLLGALLLLGRGATPQATPAAPDLARRAGTALAQLEGTILLHGLKEPVEIVRDRFGVPHIYAANTWDLFFAQGFVVAQDRLWQLEMWRRNGDGRLSEVLGPEYLNRDKFARLLQYRGDWDEEFRKYHPEARLIFDAFARGINAHIQKAIDEDKVPVEFEVMGFRPQPVWTARTLLNRMAGFALSRNVLGEVSRALDIKRLGVAKVEELRPTEPPRRLVVPEGLDLEDIEPGILELTRNASNLRWTWSGSGDAADEPFFPRSASNNWVVGGKKSVTGLPLLANDPHREVVNPSLRYLSHLVAPGWNVIGGGEPALPGVSIGHNERVAWGFTILGVDQQDLYVEETDPEDPNRYSYKGSWEEMRVSRELIFVKGRPPPVEFDVKLTRHGPMLHENKERRRAYALRWAGAEAGSAGYMGSLGVLQAKSWKEFNDGVARAWQLPSHSLVYADVDGNYGYTGVALTPVRKNWDGLLPVPGKDGRYEWDGFLPFDELPRSLNRGEGFYNTSNNDVVPKLVPGYAVPLGYEYSAPFRYDRVREVLVGKPRFSVADFERLQQDKLSLPARELMPLVRSLRSQDPELERALRLLRAWDLVVDRDSPAATVYELFLLKLGPLAYASRIPEAQRGSYRAFNIQRVVQWIKAPDAAQSRDRILLEALGQAVAEIKKKLGDDPSKWRWGDLHTADFVHPLGATDKTRELFRIEPIRRGGDGYTVMAATNPSETSTKQVSGASLAFVLDVQDWDRSTALNTPGQSAQPRSPHYADLAPLWGEAKYFPLAFSRKKVEEVAAHRLRLEPIRDNSAPTADEPFEPVQPELFSAPGAQPNAWGDYDGDGDLDLFVGFRGGLSRLYRNDGGRFSDVAAQAGVADANEVRAAAWGDYDGDGDLDLFVGFARGATGRNRLYRNDAGRFSDVGREAGIDDWGTSRQPAFVDFDNDGDVDLFVAFRDRPNALYRNDGGRFSDVAKALGVDDARKTVGAAWFDFDQDGDLDLFVANQDGDLNGFFRNDGGRFTDVARELGVDGSPRPLVYGGVGPSVGDFDNDGDLDVFVANYGPDNLYRNDGGRFTDVAASLGVAGEVHNTTSAFGDFDNDGWLDAFVSSTLANVMHVRDNLFRFDGSRFSDVTPPYVLKHDASHGVQWADFDQDGDLDLALADNGASGLHFLFRNRLSPERARRSLSVLVQDERGRYTRAGSEVRLYAAGTRTLLGTRLVDTGSGYCSQNAMPVHFGLPKEGPVDVEVTALTSTGRKITRVVGVDPRSLAGKPLVVRVPAS